MNVGSNQSLLDGYLDSLAHQRKLSPHTVSSYRRDLNELRAYTEALGQDFALVSLNHFHIRRFASQLHAKDLDPRLIARKLSAWRGFFAWLADEISLPSNPVDGVKAPKRGKPLPKALSADDAVRLVSQVDPQRAADVVAATCNQAMFELLYSSGLRVSELVQLDCRYVDAADHTSPGWIDFDASEVTVTGKGGRMRRVPVGRAAIAAITAWLALRSQVANADPHALFISTRGSRMSPRVVQQRLKAHALALGIPANVHPHVLRHSFASHVLQSSGDLRAVQEMLGHASIAATQVYTSLDFQRLASVYDAAHPRARKK